MKAGGEKRRLVITISDAPETDADRVVKDLTQKGFQCVENLSLLNCLLGEYAGDVSELSNVDGVTSVEEEGTMTSQ
jgi:hypothetical protein